MRIKAVLFDLDGTLRDTREVIYPALEHALQVHAGRVPTREEMADYIHHHSYIHQQFSPQVDLEEFKGTYYEKIDELLPFTTMYEGVVELLQELRAAGYKLAIVSSASRVSEYLETTGLLEYFPVFIGANDTTRLKPDPEPVQVALDRLGVKSNQAVMVGDLSPDIVAAQAANVAATVGLTHGFGTKKSLQEAGADYVIDALSELPAVLRKIAEQ